jgi:hypothetical protein
VLLHPSGIDTLTSQTLMRAFVSLAKIDKGTYAEIVQRSPFGSAISYPEERSLKVRVPQATAKENYRNPKRGISGQGICLFSATRVAKISLPRSRDHRRCQIVDRFQSGLRALW